MALIECPDCGRKVSDRATSCPDCMCPVGELMAEKRKEEARQLAIASRERTERDVDCPSCDARGYYTCSDGYADWCVPCEHTGRLVLCKSAAGWFGVATYAVERFLAGELHPETSGVVFFVGEREPKTFRYPAPAERHEIDPDDIPW